MNAALPAKPNIPLTLLVVILASLTAFAPLSIDMYLPAFPMIAEKFGVTVARVELSLAAFFIGLALGQLVYGPMTDRFGRKPPLYIGLVVYIAASLGCAFAPTVEALIAWRFFQALGACGGIVIARAMVRDLFSHAESARVFSLLLLVMGVAPILAPLAGGYVAVYFGWPAIFGVVALIAAACLAAVALLLPETKGTSPEVRLRDAFTVYRQIITDRSFIGFALAGGFAQAGMFAYITGSPFVFIELFGVAPENYGWIFGANAGGLIAFSQLNGRLVQSSHPTKILRTVLVFTAGAGVALAAAALFKPVFLLIVVPVFFFVASLGMVSPNSSAGALAEQGAVAGSASALLGTLQFGLAAIASTVVSHFGNGTALPMSGTIAVCGILALMMSRLTKTENGQTV